jgi:hypothetical protein
MLPYTHIARQQNMFVNGIHRVLVTDKGWSAVCSTNHCQGQLQTTQSIAIPCFLVTGCWKLSLDLHTSGHETDLMFLWSLVLRLQCFWMWRCVFWYIGARISEKHAAFMFSAELKLKIQAVYSYLSETLVYVIMKLHGVISQKSIILTFWHQNSAPSVFCKRPTI